jgi:hypothetical protein
MKKKDNHIQRSYNEGYCNGVNYALKLFEAYQRSLDANALTLINVLIGSKEKK